MAKLSIVATPIGNLEDITLRALRILKESDFVLCEDTRVTKKILDHYKISTPTFSYHQHSGPIKIAKILDLLKNDKNLALVTDAGTPGISDPGSQLVTMIRDELGEDLIIESIPGPSALTAAVSLAGVGFDRFLFLGFLPHKKGRQTIIKEIMASHHSVVLYESKHRILKLLQELLDFSDDIENKKELTIAREITKMHESLYFGSIEEVKNKLELDPNNQKGEFVVLIKSIKKNKYE